LLHASKELLWLRQLLKDMNFPAEEPSTINKDNQECIQLIESNKCGDHTIHIDVCYHSGPTREEDIAHAILSLRKDAGGFIH